MELEPARRRVEAGERHAVDENADRLAVLDDDAFVPIDGGSCERRRGQRRFVRLYTLSFTLKTPYFRMYASGVSASCAAASGSPGTEFSNIHP